MGDELDPKDIRVLKTRVPINQLSDSAFAALCADLEVESLDSGSRIFSVADEDDCYVYLLAGRVVLSSGGRHLDQIDAGSEAARSPLAHHQPRAHDATVVTRVRLVRIDRATLDAAFSAAEKADAVVDKSEPGTNWTSVLLRSRVLRQLPPANVETILERVEAVEAVAGETIIKQGAPGNSYFVLTAGQAAVTRKASRRSPEEEIARLGPGSAFGEEALLSDSVRNSTVTMVSDGNLLRLDKADFLELIEQPVSRTHTFGEARELVEQGATWLDVRNAVDYEALNLPGSVNIPFEDLRDAIQAGRLDRRKSYIALSDSAREAVAAAFLATEHGLDVSVMAGDFKGASQVSDSEGAAEPEPEPVNGQKLNAVLADRAREAEAFKKQIAQLQRALEAKQRPAEVSKQVATGGAGTDADLQASRKRVAALEQELVQLRADGDARDRRETDEMREALDRITEERDQARRQAADLSGEIDELRSMVEVYSEQVSHTRDTGSDTAGARNENAGTAGVAGHEIDSLRDELALAQAKLALADSTQDPDRDALKQEALRQEVIELKDSLKERQRELKESAISRQRVEDELEDAHAEVDRLQILLDSAIGENNALKQHLTDAGVEVDRAGLVVGEKAADDDSLEPRSQLTDSRLRSGTIDIDSALEERGSGAGLAWLWLVLGVLLGAAGLEAVAVMSGGGVLEALFGGG